MSDPNLNEILKIFKDHSEAVTVTLKGIAESLLEVSTHHNFTDEMLEETAQFAKDIQKVTDKLITHGIDHATKWKQYKEENNEGESWKK